jgi:hypothetical protein
MRTYRRDGSRADSPLPRQRPARRALRTCALIRARAPGLTGVAANAAT